MNQVIKESTNYNTVDVFKLFFCLCIISLHSQALDSLGNYWFVSHLVFRLAVPFFFVTSGYFWGKSIFDKHRDPKSSLKKLCFRCLIPLVTYSILYYGYFIFKCLLNHENITYIVAKVIQYVVFYPLGALWFLQACIVAALLLFGFIKRDIIYFSVIIGLILYCFALVTNSYYFLIENTAFKGIADTYLNICISSRNGLFVGLLFVGIGVLIARYKLWFDKISGWSIVLIMLFSFCTLFFEVWIIKNKNYVDDNSQFISLIVLIPSIMILAMRWNLTIRLPYKTFRSLSVGMYFMHRLFLDPIQDICRYTSIYINPALVFGVVVLAAGGTCLLLLKSNNKYVLKLVQ